jgi:carboxymethylenebutenolidase
MKRVSRRVVLGGIATLSMLRPTHAGTPEKFSVEADEGGIALDRYAADGVGKRAGVLILHGVRGIELKPRAYQRYADALNAAGIDAYLVRYFGSDAEQVTYPGREHGFDFSDTDPMTADAIGRVIRFFQARLGSA